MTTESDRPRLAPERGGERETLEKLRQALVTPGAWNVKNALWLIDQALRSAPAAEPGAEAHVCDYHCAGKEGHAFGSNPGMFVYDRAGMDPAPAPSRAPSEAATQEETWWVKVPADARFKLESVTMRRPAPPPAASGAAELMREAFEDAAQEAYRVCGEPTIEAQLSFRSILKHEMKLRGYPHIPAAPAGADAAEALEGMPTVIEERDELARRCEIVEKINAELVDDNAALISWRDEAMRLRAAPARAEVEAAVWTEAAEWVEQATFGSLASSARKILASQFRAKAAALARQEGGTADGLGS